MARPPAVVAAAFETYRAEVQQVLRQLGVRKVRFVDEPVAAALGYGISLTHERNVLVVDVGGGTMHVVLARLSPRGGAEHGQLTLAEAGQLVAEHSGPRVPWPTDRRYSAPRPQRPEGRSST